ncbi:MAG: hypothetical protein PHV23_00595 [Candidatus Gracilibacteria bacterium]|nr:hypothetical protein [Candidatus Gracilibacteria bacterium]
MKNKKILAGALITTLIISGVGSSFAAYNTTSSTAQMNNRMEKPEMTEEQKLKMDAIKLILDKKEAGETITSAEQTLLDDFEANKPQMGSGQTIGNKPQMGNNADTGNNLQNGSGQLNKGNLENTTSKSKISAKYKTSIDKKIESISTTLDSYSNDIKKEKLEYFVSKVEAAQTKLNNSSAYTDAKKATYNSLFDYIIEKTRSEIDGVDYDTEEDDILNDIFN